MKLARNRAENLVCEVVDVDHRHVDVIHVHRADTLKFDDGDPIVVKLNDRVNPLSKVFANAIHLDGRLERYRFGFLAEYGHFNKNAPIDDHLVTFVQAYNPAATMAQATDFGTIATFVHYRGYIIESAIVWMGEEETRRCSTFTA